MASPHHQLRGEIHTPVALRHQRFTAADEPEPQAQKNGVRTARGYGKEEQHKARKDPARTTKEGLGGAETMIPLLSCLAYSCCSLSVVLANKFLSNSFVVDLPRSAYSLALLMFQALCNIIVFFVCYLLGVKGMQVQRLEPAKLVKWLPVNALFVSMLFTGFVSLKYNALTMVTLFKNLTNIITVTGDWFFYKKQVSSPVVASLVVMILGAFMSAYHDLRFTVEGCSWMVANCLTTSGYVLYLRKVTTDKSLELSRMDMVYYNSVLSVACTALALVVSDDVGTVASSTLLAQPAFWGVASLSGLAGFGLSVSSFWCVSATSATTYAITGALNKTPLVAFDIWLFGAQFTQKQAIFVSTGLGGGFLYSYAKVLERREIQAKTPLAKPSQDKAEQRKAN